MSQIILQGTATGTGEFKLVAPSTDVDRNIDFPEETSNILTSNTGVLNSGDTINGDLTIDADLTISNDTTITSSSSFNGVFTVDYNFADGWQKWVGQINLGTGEDKLLFVNRSGYRPVWFKIHYDTTQGSIGYYRYLANISRYGEKLAYRRDASSVNLQFVSSVGGNVNHNGIEIQGNNGRSTGSSVLAEVWSPEEADIISPAGMQIVAKGI